MDKDVGDLGKRLDPQFPDYDPMWKWSSREGGANIPPGYPSDITPVNTLFHLLAVSQNERWTATTNIFDLVDSYNQYDLAYKKIIECIELFEVMKATFEKIKKAVDEGILVTREKV